MEIEKLKISDVVLSEKNVRIHTEKQLQEFVRSLNKFGQTRAAVIDENNVVLIGNGMVEAMKRAGMKEIDVFRKTGLSDKEKKKLILADNKIYSLGLDNYNMIDEFLAELEGDLDVPGYDEEVLKSLTYTAEEAAEKLSSYGTLKETEIMTIKENAVKKEDEIKKAEQNTWSENRPDIPDIYNNSTDNLQKSKEEYNQQLYNDMAKADEQRFIICPKCGERICL